MKINLKIYPIFGLIFTLAFILFTAIGTITHEYGHILVAKSLGFDTTLHYGSMNWESPKTKRLDKFFKDHKTELISGNPPKLREKFKKMKSKLHDESLFISIGGPAQTITTGLIGLMIVFFRWKKIRKNGLKILDWIAVFLSLFWLREVFNLVMYVSGGILEQSGIYFGGDEAIIAWRLGLPPGTIPIITGVLGLLVSLFVIFNIVPKKIRPTFIASGLVGGISGFVLWMNFLGPLLLP